jgi:predicted MFS family arabinose efflux permease
VLWLAALCATMGAWLFAVRVRQGPFQAASAPFDPRALGSVFRNRRVMLATGGYLGHMWELYAMWSSVGLFLAYAGGLRGWSADAVAMTAFLTVAIGAVGCAYAGWAADRVGRSTVTIAAMSVSGLCALVVGLAAETPTAVLLVVALVWGASIVADSAQFSAAVTENADASYVGTALTVQTALGFLLTMVTIQLVPWLSSMWGWRWSFAPLALGPVVGIACMRRLQRLEPHLRSGSPSSDGVVTTR